VNFYYKLIITKCVKKTKKNVAFSSAFQDLQSSDCKRTNNMQTSAFLKLDKKYHKYYSALATANDKGCIAHVVVQERREIHTFNAHLFVQKIRSECI